MERDTDAFDGGHGAEAHDSASLAKTESVPSVEPSFFELRGTSKSYGATSALGPLDLRVERGCVALVGPNGAGKSTLMRILLGLARPQAGEVTVLGQTVGHGDKGVRQLLGYAPEGEALFPGLSGAEAVAYAGRLSGMPPAAAIQRTHQVLDYVGLREERYRPVATYSAGMRQRLKLAQALVHDPQALILDEPTEAVDPEARTDLLNLMRDLAHNHGIPILFSTHLLSDAEAVADSVVVLDKGQVAAKGTLASLKTATTHGFSVRADGLDALRTSLETDGFECELRQKDLVVRRIEARTVLEHAQKSGATVRHLAPLEMSLQEAFQQAVARGAQ
ncbi:MAG: ABC transporter ATP-binding protein [Candidatus Thermoplasmatota archaeon]|jgi:ABC-2 type transport system ATP-binding protein